MLPQPPSPTLFPYTTLFRSQPDARGLRREMDRDRAPDLARGDLERAEPGHGLDRVAHRVRAELRPPLAQAMSRSEEHTSELQSHSDLVCRLLLEKKKKKRQKNTNNNDTVEARRQRRRQYGMHTKLIRIDSNFI